MCQECQEIEVGHSESCFDVSEGWDKTVEYESEKKVLESGIKEEVVYKICDICKEEKPVSDFKFDPRFSDNYKKVCLSCEQSGRVSEEIKMKTCNSCGETKPLSSFGYLKNTKDGHSYTCKQCRNAYEIRNNSPDFEYAPKPVTIVDGKKCCTRCGVWKVVEEFSRLKKSMDGFYYYCKECQRKISSEFLEKKKKRLDYSEISGTKVCTVCGKELDFNFFSRRARSKFGFDSVCKECRSLEGKEKTKRNNFVPDLTISKICSICRELKPATEFYKFKNHADGLDSCCKKCTDKRKKAFYKNNVGARIKNRIRGRLHYFIYQGINISADDAIEFLGCTMPEFLEYIAKQFYSDPRTGREMSWENYGIVDGEHMWDIEHIIPLSRVVLEDPEQLKVVCNFVNMRPMWNWQNLRKSNKLPSELEAEGQEV